MGIEFSFFQPISNSNYSFIYPLVICLFLITIISFLRYKYSISITGCCTLASLYTEKWDLPMHFNTAIILIIMSLSFLIGGYLADRASINTNIFNKTSVRISSFGISWQIWLFFVFLIGYFLYLNYIDFVELASKVTNETDFLKMLGPVNDGLTHQIIENGRWSAYRFRFAMAMAYLSVLFLCINLLGRKYAEVFKWGIFILLFLPFIVLTSGRQEFMYLVIFSMITFFLVYRRYNTNKGRIGKEILVVSLSLLFFLVFFLGIGFINGKISSDLSVVRVLVHYAGTNISAFDVFVNEMVIPESNFVGTKTFASIYAFLHRYGVDIPQFYQYITMFTAFGPVNTNVYTAFYRYISDFGYMGCSILMLLIGFLYTFMYRKIYALGLKNWMILIYASNVYPIFLMGREERFFNEILTSSRISFVILLLLLYKFFEFMNNRKERKNESSVTL